MAFTSWRGVVGCIKPTLRPGGLEELIRMLPEGIGVLPLFLNISHGTTDEFKRATAPYEPLVKQLADAGCDLIHPEGAPPFMLLGYKGEAQLLKTWEKEYKLPFFTSGSNHVRALHALKAKKILGATYFVGGINDLFAKYFVEAGFDVLGMEGIEVAFDMVGELFDLRLVGCGGALELVGRALMDVEEQRQHADALGQHADQLFEPARPQRRLDAADHAPPTRECHS